MSPYVILEAGLLGEVSGAVMIAMIIYVLPSAFAPPRTVEVDAHGLSIVFHRRRSSARVNFAWDEIADIYRFEYWTGRSPRVPVIRVKVRDARAAIKRLPTRSDRYRLWATGPGRSGVIAQMPASVLTLPIEDVLNEIEQISGRHWPSKAPT